MSTEPSTTDPTFTVGTATGTIEITIHENDTASEVAIPDPEA